MRQANELEWLIYMYIYICLQVTELLKELEAGTQLFLLKRMVRPYYTSVNCNWFIISKTNHTSTFFQSKFNKLTAVAQSLHEDHSCRLMAVLRRYIAATKIEDIEFEIAKDNLPPLVTMQRGLLALMEQWSRILPAFSMSKCANKSKRRTIFKPRASLFATPTAPFDSSSQTIEKKSMLARMRGLFRRGSGKIATISWHVLHRTAILCIVFFTESEVFKLYQALFKGVILCLFSHICPRKQFILNHASHSTMYICKHDRFVFMT